MKQCTMNCGRAASDPRPEAQWRAECEDCVDVPAQKSRNIRCKGLNCGSTTGRDHSPECEAQHAAAIAGGVFVPADYSALELRAVAAMLGKPSVPGATTGRMRVDVAKPDKYLEGDEYTNTMLSMRAYGGSFAQHIGQAAAVADSTNRQRLQDAFPDLFEKYGPKSDFYKYGEKTAFSK